MKWSNKRHECDEIGVKLQKLTAIYLFGAGVHGKTAYEKYHGKISIKGFVDNDATKRNDKFCGLDVFDPANIELSYDEAIVITAQPSFTCSISEQLRGMGYTDNVISMQTFFPIFDLYKFGELCLSSVSFLPTTQCNLKCEHCLNFSPYIKEHQVRQLEQLKQDLSMLFSKIDTLLLLHISGGEPFTYPYLPELIDYIGQNFKDKLGRLEMTTNGTVMPSARLLEAMKNGNVYLTVDDYCDSLPQYRKKYSDLLKKLDTYGINYHILKADSWIDLAPRGTDNSWLNNKQLCGHFNACAVPWQEYREGKLYLCNYAAYADIAGIQKVQPGEYFDLNELNHDNRGELIEFRFGYSEKGYTEFCKRCLGYHNNTKSVPVAKQL